MDERILQVLMALVTKPAMTMVPASNGWKMLWLNEENGEGWAAPVVAWRLFHRFHVEEVTGRIETSDFGEPVMCGLEGHHVGDASDVALTEFSRKEGWLPGGLLAPESSEPPEGWRVKTLHRDGWMELERHR